MTVRCRTPSRIAALLMLVACGPDVPDPLNVTTYERYSCTPVANGFAGMNVGVAQAYQVDADPHSLHLGLDTALNVRVLVIGRPQAGGRTVRMRSIVAFFDSTGGLTMAMESSMNTDMRDTTFNSRATQLAASDRARLRPLIDALARKCVQ